MVSLLAGGFLIAAGCSPKPESPTPPQDQAVQTASEAAPEPSAETPSTAAKVPSSPEWTPDSKANLTTPLGRENLKLDYTHTLEVESELRLASVPNPIKNQIELKMGYALRTAPDAPESGQTRFRIANLKVDSTGGNSQFNFDSAQETSNGLRQPVHQILTGLAQTDIPLPNLNYTGGTADFSGLNTVLKNQKQKVAANHWQSFLTRFESYFSERRLRWLTAPSISAKLERAPGENWLHPYIIAYGDAAAGEIDRDFKFESWEDFQNRKAAKITFGFEYKLENPDEKVYVNNNTYLVSVHNEGAIWIDFASGALLKQSEEETMELIMVISPMPGANTDPSDIKPLETSLKTTMRKITTLESFDGI